MTESTNRISGYLDEIAKEYHKIREGDLARFDFQVASTGVLVEMLREVLDIVRETRERADRLRRYGAPAKDVVRSYEADLMADQITYALFRGLDRGGRGEVRA